MRILHGTVEVAGQMGLIAGEMKRKGHVVSAYNTFHSYLGYRKHLINMGREQISEMFRYVENYFDVYHFHYCYTFFSDFSDLQRLKEKGKKIVMHHWGDDVRQLRWASRNNPYVNTNGSYSDEIIHRRLEQIAPYIDAAIVQDFEVLPYVTPFYKQSYVVPIALDLSRFSYHPVFAKPRPLIVHAPTNPGFKGTEVIERTLDQLRKYISFDYIRVAGMNNDEAIGLYQQADLVIDQVRCGSYGLLCCEAMALGKPVICYIRDDLRPSLPADLPIISANPDTLADTLGHLLRNPNTLAEIGARGRAYVEQYHDIRKVGELLQPIYQSI